MNEQSRYIVGIDLGTTNSALAYIDRAAKGRHGLAVHDFAVPQLVAPGEAVGVVGPTRMAYERVIPIVDVTARLLSNALQLQFNET